MAMSFLLIVDLNGSGQIVEPQYEVPKGYRRVISGMPEFAVGTGLGKPMVLEYLQSVTDEMMVEIGGPEAPAVHRGFVEYIRSLPDDTALLFED